LYRITYDGQAQEEPGFLAMGGQHEAVAGVLRQRHRMDMSLTDALHLAVEALSSVGGEGGKPRTLEPHHLEVAVLDRGRPGRKFRRITGAALNPLLTAGKTAAETAAAAAAGDGGDAAEDAAAEKNGTAKDAAADKNGTAGSGGTATDVGAAGSGEAAKNAAADKNGGTNAAAAPPAKATRPKAAPEPAGDAGAGGADAGPADRDDDNTSGGEG
jgi:hypothetical protein